MASGKSRYEQVVQKRGQPLREGFTIVKVRGSPAGMHVLAFRVVSLLRHNSEIGSPAGMHVLAFRVVSLQRHNSEIGSPAGMHVLACISPAISELCGGRLPLGRLYLGDTIFCLSRSTPFSNLLRPSIAFGKVGDAIS